MTRRSPRPALALAAAFVAGLLLVGCGGGGSGSDEGYVPPKGPAKETISIAAKNFSFTPDTPKAGPGIARLELVGEGGLHDLVFDDDAYPGFQLEVSGTDTDAEKIDLKPGKYTFYCAITGHRQAGMEGTLTVK